MIDFDYKSDATEPEIGGIALDNDDSLSPDTTWKVFGTQNWGNTDYDNYTFSGNGWKHYSIPVGKYTTGNYAYLGLINDFDGGSGSNSYIKNIVISDRTPQNATFTSIASEDGYIRESSETSNQGGSNNSTNTKNWVGDNYKNIQYKIILSFDTSSLPDDAVITGATLKQKRGGYYGDATVLGDMKVDVKNPTFGSASIENSDFEASASATGVATMSYPTANGQWSTGSINNTGLDYINPTGRTQFRIYFEIDDDNDGNTDYLGFYSGDYDTASDRPKLEVEYIVP